MPDAGPLLEFHYTFADGYLIAGPSRAVVARALQIKDSTNSLMHSSKVIAMMPRDHYANFSLVFYQNVAPAIAPIAGLAGRHDARSIRANNGPQIGALTSLKPSLIAAYAEPQRITFAANGDLLGPALASLMRGDLAGAAARPFLSCNTREHASARCRIDRTMEPVIELDGLEVRFGQRVILKKLNAALTGRVHRPAGAERSRQIHAHQHPAGLP